MTDETTENATAIDKDGYHVDLATGEVLDHADLMLLGQNSAGDVHVHQDGSYFVVHDMASAEWVMDKLQQLDADLASVQARRLAQLHALGAQERKLEDKRTWLMTRFGAELQAFAHQELMGKKTKTLATGYGKLSFRITPGRVVVTDMAAAVTWAEGAQPDAVKVEKRVLTSLLLLDAQALPPGIDIVSPSETFRVDTGIGKEGKA